tara:strand:- start:4289 stop:5215 length:927 start_codon:yes stop_codon:yes gene_type:complete
MSSVLVIGECDASGVKAATMQACNLASELGESTALVIGDESNGVDTIPASRIIVANSSELKYYDPVKYSAIATDVAKEIGAEIIIMGATAMGKDLAPRLSAELEWRYAADCIGAESGHLVRPAYAGKVLVKMKIEAGTVASLRPNAFSVKDGGGGTVEQWNGEIPESKITTDGIEVSGGGTVELTEAKIVVSGGRGLENPENYDKIIRPLAEAMGAATGASRAIVDAGWVPHSYQVGQTGKTVAPELYMAVGISGAIQHLAGMSGSKCIVAINKDSEAPIFKVADYGIVTDLFDIAPILTEKMKNEMS